MVEQLPAEPTRRSTLRSEVLAGTTGEEDALCDAMFTENIRSRRRHTTTQVFWAFVAVCRDALDRL